MKIIAVKLTCTKCKTEKSLDNFYPDKSKLSGYRRECKNCLKMRPIKRNVESVRNATLKYKYGISQKRYEEMFLKQRGECAICSSPFSNTRTASRLSVDHCHKTKKVRGLLCHSCNMGLGAFKDDVRRIRKAVTYLKKYG